MANVIVEGTVSKVFASRGFSIRESFNKRDGGTVTRYWNVFVPDGQPVHVTVDDHVKANGLLQTEVSKRDARYVDHKVSNATVEIIDAPAHTWGNEEPPPATEPPEDPWANTHQWETVTIPAEDVPF